jgi:hypothetical protein
MPTQTQYKIATPRTARFEISGVSTRDACQIQRVTKALSQDAKNGLSARVLQETGHETINNLTLTETLEVVIEPTCIVFDDASVERTPGVAVVTVVATASDFS